MDDIVSVNPATLAENGRVPATSPEDVRAAVQAARIAQHGWAALRVEERLDVLKRFQKLVLARKRELAEIVTRETGKPFPEALAADVTPVLDAVRWLADDGVRVLKGERFRPDLILAKDRESRVLHEPLGVVGIIAPWNYPLAIPASQIAFALFAGNAVVVKPATATTLTALKIESLFHEAGVPKDVLATVCGSGASVGQALVDADVEFLIFTGSVPVGRDVDARCRGRGVRTCMELGGSDPAIVLEDADLDLAANGIVWSRFTNGGQTCAATKRVFVLESVATALVEKVAEKTRKLRLGDGMHPGVDVGPLIDGASVAEMEDFVEDALRHGARIVTGGKRRTDLAGHFFDPTVLTGMHADARVLREEVFGPVLPIVAVADEREAVRRANETPFGLSASVWTRDRARGERLAREIDAGTVVVNDALYTFALMETPWMGRKDSGHGVTHGPMGLLELVTPKHVHVAPGRRPLAELWWFPYEAGDAATWEQGLDFLYGNVGAKARTAFPVTSRILKKRNL